MCSSGEGITIHPELLSDAVCVLCVPVVRVSLFIQNFSVMLCVCLISVVSVLCLSYHYGLFIQNFSVMLCVCLMCSSGEGITIHPELLSDAVCLSYVFQW